MPGYPIELADLENRMGAAIVAARLALLEVKRIKGLLDDATILPDTVLSAAPLGYSPAQITQIRTSFTDLTALIAVGDGGAVQANPNNFWFTAKHLAGLNWPG